MQKDYPHQIEELKKSKLMPNRGLLWEMGTGKTKGLIDIISVTWKEDQTRNHPTIIFAPPVTLYNWSNEIEKWDKPLHYWVSIIDGAGAKRIKQVEKAVKTGGIIIINYEAVQNETIYKLLLEFKPEIVVADESHLLKNHKSKRAKKVVKIGDLASYRFILTGTPILNSVEDIFHQFRFLDKGETFGKNFYVFQSRYMVDANAAWSGRPGHFPKYIVRDNMLDELNSKIYKICSRVTKKDALPDLPPLVTITKHVHLGPEQQKAYNQMKREFVAFVKDKKGENKAVVAQLALTKALRLQQIVSGHCVTDDGSTITFDKNPRLDELENLLIRLTPDHKVIVWACWKQNYKEIEALFKKLKIGYARVLGTDVMNAKEKNENLRIFDEDDTCRGMLASRGAGGIGVNMIAACYSVVFSRNFKLGDELQSEARNHRGGSEIHDQITKINLCAKDTIDELVLEALSNKQKLSDRIIDWSYE